MLNRDIPKIRGYLGEKAVRVPVPCGLDHDAPRHDPVMPVLGGKLEAKRSAPLFERILG
jgi:hypothetical protein